MKNQLSKITAIKPDHKAIIDEYFVNGFNQTQAALKIFPEYSYDRASTLGNMVIQSKRNRAYIRLKQNEIQNYARISPAEIAKELKHIAFADLTEFAGLGPDELRELPAEKRRALQKITFRKKIFRDKAGNTTEEETTIYQIQDKLKALDMLAKHIGFFEEDNKQKASNTNILQVIAKDHPELLTPLLSAVEKANADKTN